MKKIMISLLAFAMLCNYHVVLAVNAAYLGYGFDFPKH